jgi:hypothetical protein
MESLHSNAQFSLGNHEERLGEIVATRVGADRFSPAGQKEVAAVAKREMKALVARMANPQ